MGISRVWRDAGSNFAPPSTRTSTSLTESSCKAPSLQLHHLLASLTSTQLGLQFSLSYNRHSKQQIPSPCTGAILSAYGNHPTLVKGGPHSGNIHFFAKVLCFAVIVLCLGFALRSGGEVRCLYRY
jgi:hypothetical protein